MYGLETVIGKIISKHSIHNPWFFNFVWEFFILLGMATIGLWYGIGIPTQWIYIVLGALMYALGSALYTLALYKLDVSIISPMFSFRTSMAVLIGAIFLGEILTLKQYFLIGIIFLFGLFVNIDENFNLKSFFNKNVLILLIDMLCLVFMAMFIKKAIAIDGFWTSTVWIALLGQVWLLGTLNLFKKELRQATLEQYGYTALVAVTGIIGTLAANAAYSKNISISATIISIPTSFVLAFLFSIFKPKLLESHTLKIYAIRFISAIIMIVAALKI